MSLLTDVVLVSTPLPNRSKNGIQIEANEKVEISSADGVYSLTIKDVGNDDVSSYTCCAKNKYGEATESAELTVIRKCFFETQY